MRVTSGTPSIQMLKAQQAWEARRAKQADAPKAESPAERPAGIVKQQQATPAPASAQPTEAVSPQWQQTVREVQNIASKAGYVGVTEQDIRRAYTLGESLLADYRI